MKRLHCYNSILLESISVISNSIDGFPLTGALFTDPSFDTKKKATAGDSPYHHQTQLARFDCKLFVF